MRRAALMTVRRPIQLSGSPAEGMARPRPGEHTDATVKEIAGFEAVCVAQARAGALR